MSLVQRWLREATQPYAYANQVYNDVDSALASHQTVRPKTDVYTYDDGRAELLLCLHGLLPISFRGASYNIPIAIWIHLDYPKSSPTVYVVPTSDMLVKPSKAVDPSGKCSFPYLEDWTRKSEAHNIRELLDIMQEHFSREPPLYARPRQPTTSATTSQPVSPPPTSSSSSPRPPPRPGSIPPRPQPMVDPRTMGLPGSPQQFRPAPIPPSVTPQQTGASPPVPARVLSPAQAHHTRSMTANYVPSPPNLHSPIPPQPDPSHRVHTPGHVSHQSLPSFTPSPIATQQHTPYQQPWQSPAPPPQVMQPVLSPMGHPQPPPPAPGLPHYVSPPMATPHIVAPPPPAPRIPLPNIMDEEIISNPAPPSQPPPPPAVAPPRPMNPQIVALHASVHEKFAQEMNKFVASIAQDSEAPRAAQNDLLAGEPAIKDEMARLESVKNVCKTVAGRLGAVVDAAEGAIAELKRKGDPEVDELVCATNIVHNQLINLIAEDHAIEDTIYHLHRALNDGRLDLDKFLKTTTRLAEEQFMKRALIEKITSQLPMGMRMI